jgi:hypothetical protein
MPILRASSISAFGSFSDAAFAASRLCSCCSDWSWASVVWEPRQASKKFIAGLM